LSPERRRGELRTPRGSVFLCSMANTQKLEMKDGEFKRTESQFRSFVSREPGADFPPEAGRYHLYVSYACPWASRCYAFLLMKGLEDAIGLTVRDFICYRYPPASSAPV
jgi:putative glutathione S-transferase